MKTNIKKIIPFGAALVLALCGGALAACGEPHTEHVYGEWKETVAAGCLTNGERARYCTVCGHEETEEIPAPGHDWGASKVTKAATCQEGGVRTRTCNRCGAEDPIATDPIDHDWEITSVSLKPTCTEPGKGVKTCSMCGTTSDAVLDPLDHEWGDPEIVQVADCVHDGIERKTCTRCGEPSGDVTIEALGHQWVDTRVIEPATCEEDGSQEQTCQRPGCPVKTQTVSLPALEHDWESYYTVDVQATFENAGSKSYHCSRCEKRQGETEIPKLEANKPIAYEFRTLRNNGQLLIAPTITLIVKDAETGAEVARSTPADLSGGVFTKELLPKEYTVTAENVPSGYTCASTSTVTPFAPYCNVYLTASLRQGTPTGQYKVGDVMYDFTVPAGSSTQGEMSLGELLKTKKMVLLNFWYVGCTYCEQEFPGLDRVYTRYQNVAEVIGVNQNDGMSEIRTYGAQMGLSFPLIQNAAVKLIDPFRVTGYPTSVVIDGEGVICEIVRMPCTQEEFEKLFAKYTADDYFKTPAPAAATTANLLPEAVLPEKKKTV